LANQCNWVSGNRYRPTLGTEVALEKIKKKRGIYFDPQVVDACKTLFRDKGFTFEA